MNRLKFCGFALLCVCVAMNFGCGGKKKPEGMPKLIDAKIVATQNGAPLADAALTLASTDGSCKWAIGGRTDAKGVAVLYTHGDFKGAPEGTFQVGVVKMDYKVKEGAVDEEGNPYKPTPEQLARPEMMDARFVEMRSLIPDDFVNAQTSPLEVTISSSAKEATIDVPAL